MSLRCASAGTTDLLPILVCIQYVKERFLSFAEGEGFEPPNRLGDCRFSGAVLSASQPTFQIMSLWFYSLSLVLLKTSEPLGGLVVGKCLTKSTIYETAALGRLANGFTIIV